MEYYSGLRRKEIPSFATTWVKLECIMLSEITQIEKDRYCMVSRYVEYGKKKKDTNYEYQE